MCTAGQTQTSQASIQRKRKWVNISNLTCEQLLDWELKGDQRKKAKAEPKEDANNIICLGSRLTGINPNFLSPSLRKRFMNGR